MIIHFGLHFDGLQPHLPSSAVGEVIAGPSGLLDILETQLGLPPVLTQPGEAVLAYRGCLAEADDLLRFYHRSFLVDPISVARTLLDWRSQWHEAGWKGKFPSGISKRLADMGEVEKLTKDRCPLTRGQRVQRAAKALKELETRIGRIILHNDFAELPAVWRRLLKHFEVELAPGVRLAPSAAEGTDLHRVQSRLLELSAKDQGEPGEKESLSKDGSLVVVRGVSRDLSAQAVAEYLLAHGKPAETAVIAEKDGIILDNAFERVGLPRTGFQHYSRFRAVNQVLKLALALLWEPVDPRLILQFLVHPVGPLPRHVRSTLAEAVSKQPGVGGQAWQEALDTIAKRQAERFEDTRAAIRAQAEEIRDWLDCARYSPATGAPIDVLTARAQGCASWLVARLHMLDAEGEQALFASALGQAEALIDGLNRLAQQGHGQLKRIELERLVDEVTGGSPDPDTFAEAGHARATTHPASVTQTWHTVIWWDLSPQRLEMSDPWSNAELAELEQNGVTLIPVSTRLRHRTRQWLRPVLNATKRLVLVVHDSEAGHHPLWNQVTSLFDGLEQVQLDQTLFDGSARQIPALGLDTIELSRKPLPKPRRWWELPEDCELRPRPVESYSSLEKLIYYPHQWVLNYPARLRMGRAADIADGNLLAGNLAHRLFETFFRANRKWATMDDSTVSAWLNGHLPSLIEQEGAVLFEPGRGVTRERVAGIIEYSFRRLLHHLRSADIERVQAEHETFATFEKIKLSGSIDLLLTAPRGREVVLDVKWGSEDRRGEDLEANRAVQLATYAYMRKGQGAEDAWPYTAYYIVSTGNILAQDTQVFPDAVVFEPATHEGVADLWGRIVHSVDWRWTQLANGHVEVNAEGTEPDTLGTAPHEGLDSNIEADRYDDFKRLTGWEDGA